MTVLAGLIWFVTGLVLGLLVGGLDVPPHQGM